MAVEKFWPTRPRVVLIYIFNIYPVFLGKSGGHCGFSGSRLFSPYVDNGSRHGSLESGAFCNPF